MSMNHDPELDDVLQDDELVRLAAMLRSTRRAEPPLDEAFRSSLRRQLMKSAWEMNEGRTPWWRRLSAPEPRAPRAPSLAWAGAAAGVLLIAAVVITMSGQQPGLNELLITSPIADAHAVQLQQPILVSFNQPMDHKSTEAAVQIQPATYVAFSWHDNTLEVRPTGGNLAPNTQYQVTIGPGARTQSGQQLLANPRKFTFVTQPSATPTPSPRPTAPPTPRPQAGEHRLATLALPAGATYTPQWSADSSTIYFVGDHGALNSVTVSESKLTVIVPDGVSYPAISPLGDRLAYVRGGKIEILTLASGATTDLTTAPGLTTLGWARAQLFWGTSEGVYKSGADGPAQVAALPQRGASVVSIAPDGAHAVYQQGVSLAVLDLETSKSSPVGGSARAFLGWSPDGTRFIYSGRNATVVADVNGAPIATIALSGEPSWSSRDVILVGNDTELYAVLPDGSGPTKLSSGTYHFPAWAPNGTTFSFVRGAAIWSATATQLPAGPSALDQAASQVSLFMNARLLRQSELAQRFLDDKGRQAYSGGGLPLVIAGDANFTRFYVLTQELTGRLPDTARFVVRLVLTRGGVDVSEYEETLTLRRDGPDSPFLIDNATGGPTLALGRGAEVVSVEIAAGSIKVTFDSDLVADTVADGVVVLDQNGTRVGGSSTYATNRTVVITGLQFVPGASYRLVVLPSVRDVGGRNVPSRYDLNLVGPASGTSSAGRGEAANPRLSEPGLAPSPSPRRTPAPS
ncbi:MAG TPA: Ig-like domain-containing protein [Candidatus Limnocylindria bacterium]|jgi:hypothetical protein|nr:Ig-like domain-containing protein [Candidatus Limnocylindria bacterium]